MKTKKHSGKKILSVFLAVLMVMTAWVFVAPEKAGAISVSYPVKVKFSHNGSPSGHVVVYYFNVNADGSIDTSNTNQSVTVINSFSNDGYGSSGTHTAGAFNIPGWPWKVSVTQANNGSVRFLGFYIGNIEVTGMVANNNEGYNIGKSTKHWAYNDNANLSSGSIAKKNWNVPAVSGVRSAPTAQTISVPKGSSASKTFTATFNDQYGVQWPGGGSTASLSPAPSGASVSISGNTATVTANETVFANLSNYSTSTGKGSTTLNIVNNGITASCTVTFQSPSYSLTYKDINGATKKTANYYYGTTLDCASLAPANTAITQISGNDSYHQTYRWDTSDYVTAIISDTVIDEIKGTAESHTYGNPTYVDTTNHQSVCSVCGYVKPQAHTPDSGRVTTEPGCETEGEKTFKCVGCGIDYKTEPVAALGHSFTSGIYEEKEAGENGTHYQKCIRCDKYGWGVTVGNCEEHKWQEDSRVNATCEADGLVTYKCTVCESTSYTLVLTKTGHEKTTYHKAQAKSCGVKGWSEYWTCDICGDVFTDSALTNEVDKTDSDSNGVPDAVEIAADSHKFDGPAQSKSSGKEGTHNYLCSNCGKAYGVNGVVDATEPHKWGDPTVVDSTCTKEGSKKYTCTVTGCGQTYSETIAMKDHEMTVIDAVTPECGKSGNNEYYSCSTCNKYYKDKVGAQETTVADEILAALEHTWTAHHDYDTLVSAATCQKPAVYNNHCDYCKTKLYGATHENGAPDTVNGHQFNDFGDYKDNGNKTHSYGCSIEGCDEYGPATNCTYEVTKDVASTCHTYGYTTYECTVCKNGYSVDKGLDTANHDGGTVVRAKLDAKCNSNGYTGDTHCLGCDAKLSTGSIIVADPSVHPHANMKEYEGKDSTCQTEGYEAYKYCDQCDTYEIAKKTIEVKAHKFTTYISNGDGTHTATCDTCDETVEEKATDKQNCSGGKANCVDKADCTVCGEAYGEVDGENHKTIITVAKSEPTCQTEGTVAYRKCDACQENIDEPTKITKLEHTYGAWASNGDNTHTRTCTTCDEAVAAKATETAECSGGIATCKTLAKCADCKGSYGELDSANHETQAATLKNQKDATCVAPGYTGDRHYNCCDAIKEKGTEITQLEHTYSVEVENSRKAATCIAKGEVTFSCSTCPEGTTPATKKEELPLDPKNHASEKTITVNEVTATCESDGYTGDVYYECCYDEDKTDYENRYALVSKGSVVRANGQHVYSTAVPEYMVEEIIEEKDDEENVISRELKLKAETPDYDSKIKARHDDGFWYHVQICEECCEVVYARCYTYPDHQADCTDTDICVVCDGLCSLKNPAEHKNLQTVAKVSATCEKDGVKAYYKCDSCGKRFFDASAQNEITEENESQLVIPSTKNHTIDRDATPKANNDGTHTYECSVCGEKIKESCSGGTANCQEKAKCDYCKAEYGEKNPDKHVKGTIIQGKVDPDKCKPGVSGKTVYECCPDVVVYEGDITPATEPHDWVETTDKTDNCANGYTITKTCSYCKAVETTDVAAGTHDLSVIVYESEKDCTKERRIYYACSICTFTDKEVEIDGVTYKYILEEVIPAKSDCTWTSWTFEQKPNCVVEGKKTRECMACGKTEEEILPKTEHTLKTEAGYAATCDNAGKQDYVYCVIDGCPFAKGGAPIGQLPGYEKYKDSNGLVIEALGHGDYNGDDYCDNCGRFEHENEDGTNCNCVCHKRHWFMQLIYKILRLFWKLFGISRTCCSAGTHY